MVRRYETSRGVENWLQLTDTRLSEHYESEWLQEFALYYCTVLSYQEVSQLVARRCGTTRLSDQRLFHLVREKAERLRLKQAALIGEVGVSGAAVRAMAVDLYSAEAEEVIWLEDGICVSEQKPQRDGTAKAGKERVTTDLAMLEKGDGSFQTLVAGRGVEKATYYRAAVAAEYGTRASALPVVAISDGARSIKNNVKRVFGERVRHILDWYHLQAKVYQLMTQIAADKPEKEKLQEQLINELWRGKAAEAVKLLDGVKGRNEVKRRELRGYLEKNKDYIIDYEKRREAGKIIGSGRMEKENDVTVARRQKRKGMSWSKTGSLSLAMVTAHYNQRTNYLQ